jgi:hypothetical protein
VQLVEAYRCTGFIDASPCPFYIHRRCASDKGVADDMQYCPFCFTLSDNDTAPSPTMTVQAADCTIRSDGAFATVRRRAAQLGWNIVQAVALAMYAPTNAPAPQPDHIQGVERQQLGPQRIIQYVCMPLPDQHLSTIAAVADSPLEDSNQDLSERDNSLLDTSNLDTSNLDTSQQDDIQPEVDDSGNIPSSHSVVSETESRLSDSYYYQMQSFSNYMEEVKQLQRKPKPLGLDMAASPAAAAVDVTRLQAVNRSDSATKGGLLPARRNLSTGLRSLALGDAASLDTPVLPRQYAVRRSLIQFS